MYLRRPIPYLLLMSLGSSLPAADKPKKIEDLTPLDRYIQESLGRSRDAGNPAAPGSLWSSGSRLTDLGSDLRATQVDDLVTIVVAESASAVAQGASKTQRQSSVNASVGALAGIPSPKGALTNLANASSQTQLNGEGATTRSSQLSTTLSARVTHVLPNGYFAVEGVKDVFVNSEHQLVVVRGIVRPSDITADNYVTSNRIAQMEITIKGKGVVGDAIRRPFILYRILMGLLPF
jgi:flagellar L-ring protein precursor FlgH